MRIILLAFALFWSQICLAETFPSSAAAKNFTDKVMAKVGAGDIEGGLKMMRPYTIVPSAEFDSMVGQTVLQLPVITQRFGTAVGTEFVEERKVGDSLVRLVYLSKYERHAMRWRFYMYKSPQGWVINTFNFDDKIQELF